MLGHSSCVLSFPEFCHAEIIPASICNNTLQAGQRLRYNVAHLAKTTARLPRFVKAPNTSCRQLLHGQPAARNSVAKRALRRRGERQEKLRQGSRPLLKLSRQALASALRQEPQQRRGTTEDICERAHASVKQLLCLEVPSLLEGQATRRLAGSPGTSPIDQARRSAAIGPSHLVRRRRWRAVGDQDIPRVHVTMDDSQVVGFLNDSRHIKPTSQSERQARRWPSQGGGQVPIWQGCAPKKSHKHQPRLVGCAQKPRNAADARGHGVAQVL
mmetsp:Transcript_103774/g.298121  ORF Transcript_103774/g.298121 Transcript_103774/m.298121 type:complete len:271 (-) Transcript_103774:50-862(-)